MRGLTSAASPWCFRSTVPMHIDAAPYYPGVGGGGGGGPIAFLVFPTPVQAYIGGGGCGTAVMRCVLPCCQVARGLWWRGYPAFFLLYDKHYVGLGAPARAGPSCASLTLSHSHTCLELRTKVALCYALLPRSCMACPPCAPPHMHVCGSLL